jgi:PAS domain S-box-containing protein
MKLRSHLIALVIAALLPVLIFSGTVIIIHGINVRETAESGLQDTARALSLAIEKELLAAVRTLQVLAISEYLDSGDLAKFYGHAKRVLKTNPAWENIVLLDTRGQQLVNLRLPFGTPLPVTRGGMEAVESVTETRDPALMNLFRGTVTQQYLVGVAVPVIREHKVRYVLTASGSPEFLSRLLLLQRPAPEWRAMVFDAKEKIVASTHNIDQYLGKPAIPLFNGKRNDDGESVSRGILDGKLDAYAAVARSDLFGWTVGVALPVSSLDVPIQSSITTLVLGGVALLLLGIVFAASLGTRIAGSIGVLAESAAAVVRGAAPKISQSSIVEVNALARVIEDAAISRRTAEDVHTRLAAIVESSQDAIIGRSHDGTIVSWNRGAEKIYGYSSQEIIGKPTSLLVPPDQSQVLSEVFDRLNNGEHIEHFDTRHLRKDGKLIDVSLTVSPIVDSDGNITGTSAIARDITYRKRAQENLRKQQEILQTLFEHSPVMINFVDSNGRIKLINREWERVFGWTLQEIEELNLDVFALAYPDPQYRREVLKVVSESNGTWVDFKTTTRSGAVVDTTWALIRLSDGTSIGIGQDITKRKRNEERLRSSREQLRALAANLQTVREQERTRIARELHDEIGQVLTGIKLSLEMSLRDQADNNKGSVAQALVLANELIGRVRDLSLELRPAMLDDLGLLAALEWHFARYTSQANINVNFKHDGLEAQRFDRKIETAAYRIVQEALTNVARHAGVDRVEVNVSASDKALRIRVEDQGSGFAPDSLPARATVGLSGMRERARILGGRLRIAAIPGRGTCLTAALPLNKKSLLIDSKGPGEIAAEL